MGKTPKRKANELVVIGASSGGIEALSILLNTLPSDFPAPIVIAQHSEPSRASSLSATLSRQTPLVIEEIVSNHQLENGKVYIVPSASHVFISDGQVAIEVDSPERPRPSIDLLLTTAADAYGEHLIAVILTGRGSDGAAGATTVKQAGGTVIIQNPNMARSPAMPLALPPHIVDFKTDVEQIGSLLYRLLTGDAAGIAEDQTEDIFQKLLTHVNQQASIDFRPYKRTSLLRRISRRMAALQLNTLADYEHYIAHHPQEISALVNCLLINVTEFFRDPEAFAYLKINILPQLIEKARGQDKVLRFWSAGCATGEEPYSLAMVLVDLLEDELDEWSIKLFATDVDETAITFARQGLYTEPLVKNVPDEYRERFFDQVDGTYRIVRKVRQLVTFGHQDLNRNGPFPHIDLVLCRNVLIYFNTDLQAAVLNNFVFALQGSGYLFLGAAEAVKPSDPGYEVVNKTWKIYRATGAPAPLPRRLLRASSHTDKLAKISSLDIAPVPVQDSTKSTHGEMLQLRRVNDLLLRFLPMGIVIIDRNYRLLTANTEIRHLLGLHETNEGIDFLHTVRGIPYDIVRNAIDKAFREKTMVVVPEIELNPGMGGNGRYVSMKITLMQIDHSAPELAALSINDVTEQVQTRQRLESSQVEQLRLLDELNIVNNQLSQRNKELLDTNESLQIFNEELIVSQEELQATVEEYETTNEELQATNEELETTNEETQAINEELQITNDEFRARTLELQAMTATLAHEQAQLRNISQQLVNAQEMERRAIARELHDEIGQALTAIKFQLDFPETHDIERRMASIRTITEQLLQQVRQLALDLRPAMLDDLGLLPALTWYFQRYTEQTQVQVVFTPRNLPQRFAYDVETAAYRIIQEALTNVARHAKTDKVTVELWAETQGLRLTIIDFGVGFTLQPTQDNAHTMGLIGMQERARLLDAELNIRSAPGQGTEISVCLPFTKDKPEYHMSREL